MDKMTLGVALLAVALFLDVPAFAARVMEPEDFAVWQLQKRTRNLVNRLRRSPYIPLGRYIIDHVTPDPAYEAFEELLDESHDPRNITRILLDSPQAMDRAWGCMFVERLKDRRFNPELQAIVGDERPIETRTANHVWLACVGELAESALMANGDLFDWCALR